jgi:hypothetical protein
MPLVEALTLRLGGAVARVVLKYWFGKPAGH